MKEWIESRKLWNLLYISSIVVPDNFDDCNDEIAEMFGMNYLMNILLLAGVPSGCSFSINIVLQTNICSDIIIIQPAHNNVNFYL